jgi:hypothetical protein
MGERIYQITLLIVAVVFLIVNELEWLSLYGLRVGQL